VTSPKPTAEKVAYYSLLRYVPDPIRDEAVNVGLFLVDRRGSWSRFAGEVPRGLLRSMRRSGDADAVERWIARTKDTYGAVGDRPLLPAKGTLNLPTLQEWAVNFGGNLRVTVPALATGDSLAELWDSLYTRLVSRQVIAAVGRNEIVPSLRNARTAGEEKERLRTTLVRVMRSWPNFDSYRVVTEELLQGKKAYHRVDVSVSNGTTTAIAKALPTVAGTDDDHRIARALLVEAAIDLDPKVVKLALYNEPSPDKATLVAETRDLLTEVRVQLVETRDFSTLEARLAGQLFPAPG
jgi:hypothetical protein